MTNTNAPLIPSATTVTSSETINDASKNDKPFIIGRPPNFWLFDPHNGFDLTHPATPSSPPVEPRLKLQTKSEPITIAPAKTALVIIDMQNYFLSAAMGRRKGEGHMAEEVLIKHGIPAAREAGIQIIWLNWGITEKELDTMPPSTWRGFGFNTVARGAEGGEHNLVRETPNGQDLGAELGEMRLEDGTVVDGGKKLMKGQWNTALHGPLEGQFQEGQKAKVPDVWFDKVRLSGTWDRDAPLHHFLTSKDIKTLLFTGVNTDQCVLGTLQDAYSHGWDTVLLQDGCGTTSPAFATQMVLFNCQKNLGFISTCVNLAHAVSRMSSS